MATSTASVRAFSVGNSSIRTSSRKRRLSRFRSTAECWCRGTTMPMRETSRGEAVNRTSRCTVRTRFPSRMTSCNSWPRVNRERRGKPWPSLRACVLVWQSNGEALTALLTATAENFTSPLGFHARAESVRLDPALVSGTVCRLTHVRLQKRYERSCGAVGKAIRALRIEQAVKTRTRYEANQPDPNHRLSRPSSAH
jgi:hypothetical protein